MSPYHPITPEQIARESIAASEAGAAIIYLHAREPDTGMPTTDPEVYRQFLEPIKDNCDAIINITTGQPDREAFENPDPQALFQRRLAAPKEFAPEICSFNMGPLNPAAWPQAWCLECSVLSNRPPEILSSHKSPSWQSATPSRSLSLRR
jgi:uncharacterized protein (DUF849 family)